MSAIRSRIRLRDSSAGDALRARTASDYTIASDHADQLRDASRFARQQAGELERLRNRVLYAVEDAHIRSQRGRGLRDTWHNIAAAHH
jgi:hypothetical protein